MQPKVQIAPRGTGHGGGPSVDPGRQLTGTIMGAFMSYALVPEDDDATRAAIVRQARSRAG